MNKYYTIIWIAWIWIAIICSFTYSVRAQELIDQVIAVVDREVILLSEVKLQAQYWAIEYGIDPKKDPERFEVLMQQVLQRQIDEKVLLTKAIEDSVIVSDEEVEQMLTQRIQQLIEQNGSESEVEKKFGYSIQQLKKMYRDDMRNNELIRRIQQNHMRDMSITPLEINEFYEMMKDSLPEIPEQYNISHILIEVAPGEEVIQRARARAESLRTRVIRGEDFSRLAELYSDDQRSAKDGGRIGPLKRGDIGLKEFEEALFVLKPGEISKVVKTSLGFHIIRMVEQRGDRVDAQHILVGVTATKADEQRVIDKLWELKRRAEAGEDFSQLSLNNSMDPEVKENKGNLGWVQIDKVAIEAFKKVIPTIKPGEISPPFKTNFGYHIMRLNAMKPKHRYNLTEDRDAIKQLAMQHKGMREYEKWLAETRKNMYIDIKVTL